MPWATRRTRTELRLGALRLAGLAPSGSTPRRTPPERVLLLRPDHIGDVLLTSPAVATLRASLPGAHLTYVVGPWSAEVARAGPAVDSVHTLSYPGFTRRSKSNLLVPYVVLLREAARLRRERYDLAIVFRPDHWWGALLALLAGIPVRVGGATPETTPLLTHVRSAARGEHAAQSALELARLALAATGVPPTPVSLDPTLRVAEADRIQAREFWARHALGGRRVVAMAPSAGARLKSWPVARWAQLADSLIADGSDVLLVGGPDDGPLLAAIQAHRTWPQPVASHAIPSHPASSVATDAIPSHPAASVATDAIPAQTRGVVRACGQSLGVSAALFERCALLVGLDGGQAHLAGAVGIPTVRLYGPASSETFGPWPPRDTQSVLVTHRLACVPCGDLDAPPCGATTLPACLLALDVQDVLERVRALLTQRLA